MMGALLAFPEIDTAPEPPAADEVSAPDFMDAAGITYRQLNYWTQAGYITPTSPPRGSGNPLRWKVTEVDRARRMRILIDAGLTLALAHRVAEHDDGEIVDVGHGVTIRVGRNTPTVDSPHGAAGDPDPEPSSDGDRDEDPRADTPRLDQDRSPDPQL